MVVVVGLVGLVVQEVVLSNATTSVNETCTKWIMYKPTLGIRLSSGLYICLYVSIISGAGQSSS